MLSDNSGHKAVCGSWALGAPGRHVQGGKEARSLCGPISLLNGLPSEMPGRTQGSPRWPSSFSKQLTLSAPPPGGCRMQGQGAGDTLSHPCVAQRWPEGPGPSGDPAAGSGTACMPASGGWQGEPKAMLPLWPKGLRTRPLLPCPIGAPATRSGAEGGRWALVGPLGCSFWQSCCSSPSPPSTQTRRASEPEHMVHSGQRVICDGVGHAQAVFLDELGHHNHHY